MASSLKLYESSSSSSDNEDMELYLNYLDWKALGSVQTLRERSDIFELFTDEEFQEKYRMSKQTTLKVLSQIGHKLLPMKEKNNNVTPLHQLLMTLRYFATGQMLCEDLLVVHKSSVSRQINRVSLELTSLVPQLVTFPRTQSQRQATSENFCKIAKFPGVIGSVDFLHVCIKSQGVKAGELYKNDLGFNSYNVMVVCNADLVVTNLDVQCPGSMLDGEVFNQSRLCSEFEKGEHGDDYLLGDSDVGCGNYVLTPVLNPSTQSEHNYNSAHAAIHGSTVKSCIAVLVKRFPCLNQRFRLKSNRILNVIQSCLVLHNICIASGDIMSIEEQTLNNPSFSRQEQDNNETLNDSTIRRSNVIDEYFS